MKRVTQSVMFDFRSQVVSNESLKLLVFFVFLQLTILILKFSKKVLIDVRYTNLDNANVFKIIVFSSSVIFLALNKFPY